MNLSTFFENFQNKSKEVENINQLRKEEYADDFAKQLGYDKELICAHTKYLCLPSSVSIRPNAFT